MSLLSSWDEIDVLFKLFADDVWAAEDAKPDFLSVGVDSSKSIVFVKTADFLSHDAN